MRNLCRILFFAFALFFAEAHAGGNWASFRIVSLEMLNDVDYLLVLEATPRNVGEPQDPMFRACTRLEVHGSYGALRASGRFAFLKDLVPSFDDKGAKVKHQNALGFLRRSLAEKRFVNFGYIGSGLVPKDIRHLCDVESRRLELVGVGNDTVVVSLYHEY